MRHKGAGAGAADPHHLGQMAKTFGAERLEYLGVLCQQASGFRFVAPGTSAIDARVSESAAQTSSSQRA